MSSPLQIFFIFLRLGLTGFGGPIAHLGYFRHEFVERKKWMDEKSYADLVALCQFLPGPASSQVGAAIGLSRGGLPGALAAWLGFTLPSAILLILFALGFAYFNPSEAVQPGWLKGLKIVAVAVVAHAIWGMGKKLCPELSRILIAIGTAIGTIFIPGTVGQISMILLGAFLGYWLKDSQASSPQNSLQTTVSKITGSLMLAAFLGLLFLLPLLATNSQNYTVKLFDGFYRAGALVFGGGHVVLPLLQAEVVPPGWVSDNAFLAGYGMAQAVPGPLFTFAAYLGAVSSEAPSGFIGGLIALVAVFLPSMLLIVGILPFWEQLRQKRFIQQIMPGINASVVGLLLSAFYHPVWTSAIFSIYDLTLAITGFFLLQILKWPSWSVVLLLALIAGVLL